MATLSLVESVEAFVEAIEKSGLLSPEAMAKVRDAAAKADKPMTLARPLVKDGTLTKWQASQLLYGYHQLVVGKYKLLDQLAAGDMGRVYLAEHAQMGRRHSLKVLSRRHVSKPDVLKRFLAEAQQVCGLDHRNLSHVYDVNQDGDRYYLVMEHVEGQDLQQRVEKSGKLPVALATDYVRQIAEGLAHAHDNKVVHGALKPSNLVIDASGTVKILEIGQARLAEGPTTPVGQDDTAEVNSLTSAIHLAPEQRGSVRTIDQRSDVYSLGSVLCYLLTGQAAADSQQAQKLLQAVVQVPADLTQLCVQMMAENPADRPATMQAVLDQLATAARETAPPVKSKTPDSKPSMNGNGKQKPETSPPKAKKPPVAKPLSESAGFPVAKSIEEPAPAAEEPAPFSGFAIQTKGRVGAAKPPVKSPPATSPAIAAGEGAEPAAPAKKTSYLPLILGGSIGGGVLALAGIALLVYFLFLRGGSDEEIADASKGTESVATETTESSVPEEGNPESNPGEEANPATESNPMVEAAPATASPPVTKSGDPATASATNSAEPPKPETPKPAETPMASPMPEAKPADPPMPAPMPEPPKPAPPKPAPPKPAPAGNPLMGFAKAVTLPKLETGAGDVPPEALAAAVLGPCKVEPTILVIARLKGGEFAARGGRQKFELVAANNGTALQDWEVNLVGGEAPVHVAKLGVKEGNVNFQWTPEAAKEPNAPFLMNCALELSAGPGHHTVAFREPVVGPPLAIEVEKQGTAKWPVENLPDPKSIHFEITKLEGVPRQKFDPENVMRGIGEDVTIWTGPADDTMVLGLKLDSSVAGKNLQVTSMPQIRFEGEKKAARFSKKEIGVKKTQVVQYLNGLTLQLNRLGNGRDERTEQQRSLLNQEIEKANKAGSQIDALSGFIEAIQGSGSIHFRVYYQAEDDSQVDLLVTGGEAAPPEMK